MAALARFALARAFLRLLTVQGSWNYERLLGVGFGVAELPLLRNETPAETYRAAVARGGRFFNAHPYLAGLAVGAVARAEREGAPGDQIERLRAALCGPLGSVGDRLVWAGWLPCASGLALAAVALGAGWPAVAGFLVLYNAGHLALRWWALRAGWDAGVRVAAALNHPAVVRAARLVAPGMALAVGLALPLVTAYLSEGLATGRDRLLVAGVAAVAFALLRWLPERLSGLRLGLALVGAALVAGWVWP